MEMNRTLDWATETLDISEMDFDLNRVTEPLDISISANLQGDEHKENDENLPLSLLHPGRRTHRQPSTTSSKYRLGPRIKVTDKDLDFVIYKDETAHGVPPPQREYYGSNLPALPEIKNGVKFEYAIPHQMRRNFNALMEGALERGDQTLVNALINVRGDEVPLWERIVGAHIWSVGSCPLDVWLWVQDKGYDRKWSEEQKEDFREFLEWMEIVVAAAAGCSSSDPALSQSIDEGNERLIPEEFQKLGLPNIGLVKDNRVQLTFVPTGEDENLLHRDTFTAEEQEFIDTQWSGPGRWAPGEEGLPPLSSYEYGEESEEEEAEAEVEFEGDNLIAL